jgi:methionyl-tRNA formyltransferase
MNKFDKTVAFYLMTYKGYSVLKRFVEQFSPDLIEVVVIGRDKNIENDYHSEIEHFCTINRIPCFIFCQGQSYQITSELIFAISWRWLINFDKKIIVLHDSLLPKYRGFAPLVNCLINNEPEIGVTALIANENYDCGDIICQKSIQINYPITINEAIEIITPLYSELLNEVAKQYFCEHEIIGIKQNDTDATYSLWRNDDDYFINWNDTSENIKRFIDAVGNPYKGACTKVNDQIFIIRSATVIKDLKIENRDVGKVIFFENNCPVVVCKEGLLRIDKIEDDDKKPIQFNKFRLRFK